MSEYLTKQEILEIVYTHYIHEANRIPNHPLLWDKKNGGRNILGVFLPKNKHEESLEQATFSVVLALNERISPEDYPFLFDICTEFDKHVFNPNASGINFRASRSQRQSRNHVMDALIVISKRHGLLLNYGVRRNKEWE